MNQSSRDWAMGKLSALEVNSVEPRGDLFVYIDRKKRPPFTTAIISEKEVSSSDIETLMNAGEDFDFVSNIPKGAIWTAGAIRAVSAFDLGWGGFGDLMSAMGQESVAGFQRKEFAFVERGLKQHTRVESLERISDRVFEVGRLGLGDVRVVLLNEYEMTAEHVREARDVYGAFDAILQTNPSGHSTSAANEAAESIGAPIFKWGEFLGRLNKK